MHVESKFIDILVFAFDMLSQIMTDGIQINSYAYVTAPSFHLAVIEMQTFDSLKCIDCYMKFRINLQNPAFSCFFVSRIWTPGSNEAPRGLWRQKIAPKSAGNELISVVDKAWLRLSPTFPPLRQCLGGIEATPELSSGGEDPSPRSSAKKKLKQTAPEISFVYNKTVPKHNSSGNETGPEINSCGKFLRMSIGSSNVLGQMLKPALHLLVQKCEALRSVGRANDPTVK
ncbi:unnamed protein product [Clavelina lepadiformis]|uniref:Uncharacterized protein n=1 Tax=Clavelina lepadiformis TaxID=159417 RepID=A0ABP0G9F6_CLALP